MWPGQAVIHHAQESLGGHLRSVIHEYVFIVAVPNVIGWQTAFFMLHGVVAVGGVWAARRMKALVWRMPTAMAIGLTFLFIYSSSFLFMRCMDELLIFHEGGVGSRLLAWTMGIP